MELKKGYKKTEVGVIPEDWDVKVFGEVMDGFSSGQTPYRAIPDYYKGNIPWITSGELNYNVIVDTLEKITKEGAKAANLKIIPKGTFLFAITGLEAAGTRGSCAITGIEATSNQSCMALYPKKDVLTTSYLYHYYVNYGNELALKYCQGTKQQSYTGAIAKKLPIIIPPTLTEQTAIATALSDVDALISNLEKLIAKKKAIKQGAMQQLLTGKTRLKGFEGNGKYKQTEVGLIPEDWEVTELKKCLIENPKYGIGAAAIEFNSNYPTYLRITDIDERGLLIKNGLKSVNHKESSKYFLENGDLVFARTGASVGKSYKYNINDGLLVFAGFLIKVKPNPNVLNTDYLKSFVETKTYWNWVKVMSMRSGQPGINSVEYGNLPLLLPSTIEEQNAIAGIISDMDNEIEQLESKKLKFQDIKQGMMQELLTGKTRLV